MCPSARGALYGAASVGRFPPGHIPPDIIPLSYVQISGEGRRLGECPGVYVRGKCPEEYVWGICPWKNVRGICIGKYVRGMCPGKCPGNMSGNMFRGKCPGNMFQGNVRGYVQANVQGNVQGICAGNMPGNMFRWEYPVPGRLPEAAALPRLTDTPLTRIITYENGSLGDCIYCIYTHGRTVYPAARPHASCMTLISCRPVA